MVLPGKTLREKPAGSPFLSRPIWLGTGLAGAILLAWLAGTARRGAPNWPAADGALIEMYTIHATQGAQLLGAYSQYGWYHPGPLLFYLLAPFYAVSSRTVYGLDLGALVINVASLLVIASMLGRRRGVSPLTAVLLLAGLFAYVARIPELLTSAWNPHISVWPFAALLVCTAATADGSIASLPLVTALASLVTQTHVGFAPVAIVLGVIAVAGSVLVAIFDPQRRLRSIAWVLLSLVILQTVWLPVLADELTGDPGNLSKIWHFFFQAADTQTLAATTRAWSSMLTAAVRPDLTVASGVAFAGSTNPLVIAAGTIVVAALPIVAVLRWREGYRFESVLAIVCFVASAVGFWSVLHIHGQIGDYQLFWLSVLGVFDLAISLGAAVALVSRRLTTSMVSPRYAMIAASLFGLAAVVIGSGHLVLATQPRSLPDENENVRRLTTGMQPTLASMGAHRPLFRIEGNNWAVGVGLMLQLARAGVPFGADADFANRFDPNLSPNGAEDVLVTLSGSDQHQQLAMRPGNVTLAEGNWRVRLYVDAVSLVDHPEYKLQ